MTLKRFLTACLVFAASLSSVAHSQETMQNNVGYYGFEPDIITNYVSVNNNKIGFVRITVELMINDVSNVSIIEHHAPLLRDAIIDVLIRQPEQKVKSMTGREEIRVLILDKLRELMKKETGQTLVRDLFFAKYLYH
ncbi:MAG: flagellar basal body-associated protein FliL [Gammaproteobacteria bacterium]|nr:flagellar basal body-associated protein FliL [Gammaproteobacteria bacterium]